MESRVVRECIDPERAKELLATVGETYRFRKHHYERLRTDMLNNEFHSLESHPLVVDQNGALHNGRHRLTALRDEGKTYDFWVHYMDTDAAERWDVVGDNAASWTLGDHLRHKGVKDSNCVSSSLTYLHRYVTNTIMAREVPTRSQALRLLKDNSDIIRLIPVVRGAARGFGISPGMCVAIAYLTSSMDDVDMDDVERFWGILESLSSNDPEVIAEAVEDAEESDAHPLITLAKWLNSSRPSRNRSVRRPENTAWAFINKTWNAYITRENLKVLRWGRKESFPALKDGLGDVYPPHDAVTTQLVNGYSG